MEFVPLTYEVGEYTGNNWLVASVNFGTQPNGDELTGHITTNHVHASELFYNDPEDELRLWSSSHDLLRACKKFFEATKAIEEPSAAMKIAIACAESAIKKATVEK